jgi:sec-independent protein translocase protein TatA
MTPVFGFLETLLAPQHILILLVVGILLFGKRLPEMGRYLGKGIVEFKKGMKGLEDEISGTITSHNEAPPQAHAEAPRPPQRVQAAAPKFEDNAGEITPPKA